MINWSDRRVKFAVGLAVLVIGLKWLITGTPLMAIDELRAPPRVNDDGDAVPQTTIFLDAMLPIGVDLLIGAIIAIGAWVINLGEMVVGWFNSKMNPQPQIQPIMSQSISGTVEQVEVTDDERKRTAVLNLARAAAANDKARLEQIRIEIRKPQAIAELTEAYDKGDLAKAAMLKAELDEMMLPAATATTPVVK